MPQTNQAVAEVGGERGRRLSDGERDAILAKLDQSGGLELRDGVPLLRGNRAPWRRHDIALMVEHPGGGVAQFSVSTHALSASTLTCIHHGFLHRGTACTVHLPSVWDAFQPCPGRVESCDHVCGLVHKIDVRFAEELDLRQFLDKGPVLTKLTPQATSVGTLSGRLLHLESEATIRETVRFLLRETRLETVGVETVGAALDECKRAMPAMILANTDLDGWTAERAIVALREGGIVSPVLLVTGETHPAKVARAKASGVASVVELPTTEERLIEAIRPWLPSGPAVEVQAIQSTRAGDPAAQAMLRAYTERLGRWREELQARMHIEDFDGVRGICMSIKSTALTVGFETLAEAARRCVVALDASSSLVESAPSLLGLIATLSRVKGVGGGLN